MAIHGNPLCGRTLLFCAAALCVSSSPVSAQCGLGGCSTPSPQVGLPPVTRPSAAKSALVESRIAALEARMNRMTAVSAPTGTPGSSGKSSTKSASKAFLAAINARTWTNGEGLWQMSPSGATCQLSSGVSTLNSSPCSGSF